MTADATGGADRLLPASATPASAGDTGPPADKPRLPADKPRLRAEMRTRRVALGPDSRAAAGAAACRTLLELPELSGTGPFLLYAAFGDELSVDAAAQGLLARGAVVCLPRVRGERLDVVAVRDLDELVPGWLQVREPPPQAPAVPAPALRAAVVPGLAFDTAGNRLGYGGGHFDRLLAQLDPDVTVIGVAFETQVVPSLPAEAHDRPVHVVVTESRVIRAR